MTWNAQGGNKWEHVRSYLLKDADILALQEVNTPPVDFVTHDEMTRLSNTGDTSTTPGGLPSLKYRVFTKSYASGGTAGNVVGQMFYVDILDKNLWGSGGTGDDEDPDTQKNTQKSMAVWVNKDVAADFDALKDIKIVTPRAREDNDKWIRSRPAVGVRVKGTWYFNIHAASIRSGSKPNPHAKALTQAVAEAVGNEPWRILGDFNSDAQTFRSQVRDSTYYATRNGKPDGIPVPTQQSGYWLDFITSSEKLTDLAVSISSRGGSDHWPVRFAPAGMRECMSGWDSRTVYNLTTLAARAVQDGDVCVGNDAVVSMGDSYISGEGGRWQGNGAGELSYRSRQGSAFGTDRAAYDCTGTGKDEVCEHEPKRVYGETASGKEMCHRSDLAPIKSIGDVLGIPAERRFNIACSGATTTDVTDNTFKGEEPQVKQLAKIAAENNVKYVVLSIGGNDLGFSDIGFNCVVGYVGNKPCSTDGRGDVYKKTATIREKVSNTIAKIRATMSEAGQENPKIILQAYPNPVSSVENNRYPSKALSWARMMTGGCALLDPDVDWLHYEVVPRLNEALADAAHEQEAIFLNTQNAFAGHELCAKASSQASELNSLGNPPQAKSSEWVRWIPGLANWLPYTQGDKQEAIHPNAFGQQALGTCVAKTIAATSWQSQGYFTCAGSAGATPEQMEVTQKGEDSLWPGGSTGPVSRNMQLRNASSGDLADADWGGDGAWGKATGADGSARQLWHVDDSQKLDGDLVPALPVRAVATIKYGDNFLHTDDGPNWAKIVSGRSGKPVSWAVAHTLYNGSSQLVAYESNGKGGYDITGCLTQNPGRIGKDHQSWLSVETCTNIMYQQWWFEDPGTVGAQPNADGWAALSTGQLMSSAAQTCVSGGQVDQVGLAQCGDGKEQQWQARASVTAPSSGMSASSAAATAVPGSHAAAVRSGRVSLASDPAGDPHGAFFFVNQSSGQCLDYDRTNDEVLQWECNGGDNQQWYHYGDTLRSVYNGQCLKPGENDTLVATECSTAPEEWEGGIEPKDNDRVSLQSATGLAMDLTAGDTSAGTKILGWTPCRCKNNQIWDLHADAQGIWRMAPMALDSRHVSYDAQDRTVTLMDAVADNKGEQWRLEAVGGGWYRIVSTLDGAMVTAIEEGAPLALREPSNDLGQLWKITLNNR
ncbi:ricin-type beta-trefoil lectin domain protein [Streptomyces sp. NBC_00572]|uniref:ricin-type beta-trefoil lectin domain protein n=1 Tax=Streptomyces sp. NBC_00572 TaxID=2903664 RepID=UPI00225BB97A|nr:ricin-type beta-trefoil lectin domain protein [Streptomyces sp. NBC_00572]MCX4985491.1 RICIN domain-containing protein [Streptomyces sp. NBC_00572]